VYRVPIQPSLKFSLTFGTSLTAVKLWYKISANSTDTPLFTEARPPCQ